MKTLQTFEDFKSEKDNVDTSPINEFQSQPIYKVNFYGSGNTSKKEFMALLQKFIDVDLSNKNEVAKMADKLLSEIDYFD